MAFDETGRVQSNFNFPRNFSEGEQLGLKITKETRSVETLRYSRIKNGS